VQPQAVRDEFAGCGCFGDRDSSTKELTVGTYRLHIDLEDGMLRTVVVGLK
jgi:hypothetical protein